MKAAPIKVISDYMGLPKLFRCNCQTLEAACMSCNVRGVSAAGRKLYPGAVLTDLELINQLK